jgi:hypothetical protein
VGTLLPGPETAIMRGNNGSTGVGLVQVYDLDPATNSELVNVSTRGFVETGNDVMIGPSSRTAGTGTRKFSFEPSVPRLVNLELLIPSPIQRWRYSTGMAHALPPMTSGEKANKQSYTRPGWLQVMTWSPQFWSRFQALTTPPSSMVRMVVPV